MPCIPKHPCFLAHWTAWMPTVFVPSEKSGYCSTCCKSRSVAGSQAMQCLSPKSHETKTCVSDANSYFKELMLSESMNQHFKTYKWKFISKIIQQNPVMWRKSPGNVFHWSFMIPVSWCSLLCQWSFRGGKGILWTLQWLDVALHFCFAQMLRAKCWGFQKSTLSMEHVPKGGRNSIRWWWL